MSAGLSVALLLMQSVPNAAFSDLARRAAAALDHSPEEAVSLYRQALALQPSWAEGWLYAGASLYQLGRYAEAREALLKGAALAPAKGTAWGFLGLCEYELRDYDQALNHIQKSESLGMADNPQFMAAVRQRGALIYLQQADFKRAVEQLRPLAAVGGDSPAVIDALGLGVLAMPVMPSSIPANQRALVTLAGHAAWYFFAQRPEEAQAAFQQLLDQYPNQPGVHYASGIFLLDRDPDAALAEFRKEVQTSPAHVLARLQIALLEIKAGHADAAIEAARQAVKLDGANFLCQIALGRALLSAGDFKQAIPPLQAGVKLAPGNPQSHFLLEQAYRRDGRDSEARQEKAEFTRLRAEQDPLNLSFTGSAP